MHKHRKENEIMANDVSIAISAKDNFTAALTKMKQASGQFNSTVDDTQKKLTALNNNKATLKLDLANAKAELKAAQKGLDDTQESVDRLSQAQLNVNNIESNLRLVSSQAKEAEKALTSMADISQKIENKASGGNSASVSSGSSGKSASAGSDAVAEGILSRLGGSGAVQMIGDTITKAAETYVSSAYNSDTGTMLGSIGSGAASGAAIGTAIAPGVGTAIGAALGGTLGAINGSLEIFKDKDEYFKNQYQAVYEGIQDGYAESLSAGSSTAAARETAQISFGTLLGGDEAATAFLSEMKEFSNVTPFTYDDVQALSKTLLNFDVQAEDMLDVLTPIGDAGAALGMSSGDRNAVATYLGRMKSTDKTTLEYINPLIERGIDAIGILEKSLEQRDGKDYSTADVYSMISKGELSGAESFDTIIAGLKEAYGGAMELQAQTFEGLTSTLESYQADLDAAMGEGYNETRKEGMQQEIAFLQSFAGEEYKEAYRLMGEYQASLENKQAEMLQESLENAMKTPEFLKAQVRDDGAKMGEILTKAKAEAQTAYTQTEEYQAYVESQRTMITDVRNTVAADFDQAGYELGQEFSYGLKKSEKDAAEAMASVAAAGVQAARNLGTNYTGVGGSGWSPNVTYVDPLEGNSHAYGLERVPYDNYLALLHQDEQVLTAREARKPAVPSVNVTITGNSFSVRGDDDIDSIADAVVEKLSYNLQRVARVM